MASDPYCIRVSIIIPCYNAEHWIGKAVASALAQTANVVEVIVVDDGSTDASVRALEGFSDDRVIVMRGAWGNGNAARNHGLASATGEWVQFLDADDFLLPDKLANQLAAADEDSDVIYSPLTIRNETSGEETVQQVTLGSDLIEQWLRWELCQTGAALWRTEPLRGIGGWKEGLPCCQDNELTLRALMKHLKFQYVNTPGAVYRIWSEDTVCRKDPRKVVKQKTELIDSCLMWLDSHGNLQDRHRRIAGQVCFGMARSLAQQNMGEAADYFRERQRRGLISVSGHAAPHNYRLIQRLVGFQNAERLAQWMR